MYDYFSPYIKYLSVLSMLLVKSFQQLLDLSQETLGYPTKAALPAVVTPSPGSGVLVWRGH